MPKTDYSKLRTKVLGLIEGLTLADPAYFSVRSLLTLSEKVHCNTRKDGAPEFSHQLEMLALALSLHDVLLKPRDVYMAILAHDLYEDYPNQLSVLQKSHPEVVRYAANTLAKYTDSDAKSYYTYFANIAACEVCSIVKLIDRVHNLSTAVGVFSNTKLDEYVEETEKYFFPMCRLAKDEFNQRSAYEVLKAMLLIQCRTIKAFRAMQSSPSIDIDNPPKKP